LPCNWKHGTSHGERYAIFFGVKLGDNSTITHEKVQLVFGDDAMSRAEAFGWHKMFFEGRARVQDEQCSGLQSTRTGDNTTRIR
jgi:hypothetical protein